ncbi:cytochrome P450 [Thozetella sp. PMI_491]|nr:cytochrome P450 [Thozetella sp. PMI_491]
MGLLGAVDPLGLATNALIVLFASLVSYLVIRGYQVRTRFRALQKRGIPMMKHSAIFGHLIVVGELLGGLPKDAHFDYLALMIRMKWKELFPDFDECPPVVYIDMWPFAGPMLASLNISTSSQFTQEGTLRKALPVRSYLYPLTKTLDLSTLEGAEWKVWRKRLSPGFSPGIITEHIPMLVGEIEVFAESLRKAVGENGNWGAPCQLEEMGTKLTLDVMGRYLLNTHLNEQSGELSPFSNALINNLSWLRGYVSIFDVFYLYNPWRQAMLWHYNRIMNNFILAHLKKRIGEAFNPADKMEKNQFMRLLVKSLEDEKDSSGKPDSRFINIAVNQTKHFFFAGHDTTASTICWVIHSLINHPECLEKLRAEIDTVLGPEHTAASAAAKLRENPNLVNSLTYTNAVIRETLRVHTNIGTYRDGAASFEIYGPPGSKYEGMKFPTEGFSVWDANWAIHRDPALWPRVDEFVPERWLITDENDPMHPPRNGWRPFELGPRDCIGQHIAMVEIKLVLALVLKELDVEEAYEEWDAACGRKGAKPEMVFGKRCYQVNPSGTPHVKDKMPVRVRVRA